MTLRGRILLIVCAIFTTGTVALLLVVGSLVAENHREVEEESLRRDLARAEALLRERVESLRLAAEPYAGWDRSAAFIRRPDPGFMDGNFDPSSLEEMRFDLVAFLDRDGSLLAFRGAVAGGEGLAGAVAGLAENRSTGTGARGEPPWTGVMVAGGRPMLVAVLPVASPGASPPEGYFVAARGLAGRELALLGERGGVRVAVTARTGEPSAGGASVRFTTSRATGRLAVPLLDGGGALSLGIERERDPLTERYPPTLVLAILLIAVVCGVLPFLFVDRRVLRRIRRLAAAGGASPPGGDELDLLETKIAGVTGELERSTAELRESEARWRMMVESAPMAIGVSTAGRIRFLNAAGLRILGVKSPDEILGKAFLDFFPKEYHATIVERMAEAEQRSLGLPPSEYPMWCPDGRQITIGITSASIVYGGASSMLTFFRDVSDRRRIDDELARYRDGLERLVRDRTVSLTAANERLLREAKQREKVETALRESAELYRTLVETSPIGIAMSDASGRLSYASSRLASLLGYERPEDLVGLSYLDTVAPGEREVASELFGQTLSPSGSTRRDILMLRLDGTTVPVALHAGCVRDAAGNPTAIVATFLDITKRRTAEQRLWQSELLHRTLFETMPLGIGMTDMNGSVTFASRRLVHLLGLAGEEQILGRNFATTLAPGERERSAADFSRLLAGEPVEPKVVRIKREDGTTLEVAVQLGVMRGISGAPTATVAVFSDVSERREVERKLRESEELHRTLLGTAPIGVVTCDNEGRITFFSERGRKILGIGPGEEPVGQTVFSLLAPGDEERAQRRFGRSLAGMTRKGARYVFRGSDGRTIPVIATAGVLHDDDGKPTGLVITFMGVGAAAEEGGE